MRGYQFIAAKNCTDSQRCWLALVSGIVGQMCHPLWIDEQVFWGGPDGEDGDTPNWDAIIAVFVGFPEAAAAYDSLFSEEIRTAVARDLPLLCIARAGIPACYAVGSLSSEHERVVVTACNLPVLCDGRRSVGLQSLCDRRGECCVQREIEKFRRDCSTFLRTYGARTL